MKPVALLHVGYRVFTVLNDLASEMRKIGGVHTTSFTIAHCGGMVNGGTSNYRY
jgi:hypothetical protein